VNAVTPFDNVTRAAHRVDEHPPTSTTTPEIWCLLVCMYNRGVATAANHAAKYPAHTTNIGININININIGIVLVTRSVIFPPYCVETIEELHKH
jgi:hypothetical protein